MFKDPGVRLVVRTQPISSEDDVVVAVVVARATYHPNVNDSPVGSLRPFSNQYFERDACYFQKVSNYYHHYYEYCFVAYPRPRGRNVVAPIVSLYL